MAIHYRPMRPNDVHECVEIVAAHPIVGPRYGSAIADLGPAWLRLIYSDGFGTTAVLEETNGAGTHKLAVGVSVFASDDFLREVKTPPSFWVGPELARRVAGGDSPLLSPAQAREANTRGGLNLLAWENAFRPGAATRAEAVDALMVAFHTNHRGFLIKEIAAQAESLENLMAMRNAGGLLWNPSEGCYSDFWHEHLDAVVQKPHLSGMTRAQALARAGSWLSSIFLLYQPPQIGFSRSEQRLLISAVQGSTDQELSDELSISLATVKKTWLLIYERVSALLPELIPAISEPDDGAGRRGREKKRRLIAYLREHPEEMRPVSRKGLQPAAAERPAS